MKTHTQVLSCTCAHPQVGRKTRSPLKAMLLFCSAAQENAQFRETTTAAALSFLKPNRLCANSLLIFPIKVGSRESVCSWCIPYVYDIKFKARFKQIQKPKIRQDRVDKNANNLL